MPVFLILSCEMGVFSLLLGAYMHSLGLGLVILGASSLVIYPFFQRLYSPHPFLWIISFLGSLTTLFWASYIDYFLETNFIAIFLSLTIGAVLYVLNYLFVKKYYSIVL